MRIQGRSIALFAASLLWTGHLSAGNWSGGGGGEILEHALNPWFLDGVPSAKPIKYCVIQGSDFEVDRRKLEDIVQQGFAWWRNQFTNAYYPENNGLWKGQASGIRVYVNTSNVKQDECTDDTDLRFQFGHVTEAQEVEFKKLQVDLTRYVAITIRTDYDDHLRGKGFIYVSPDHGPRAFRGQDVVPNAWTSDEGQFTKLRAVVTHELGHVFGLAHSDNESSIMSGHMAERIVSNLNLGFDSDVLDSAVFFPKKREIQTCALNEKFRRFFEIPKGSCVRFRFNMNFLAVASYPEQQWNAMKEVGIAEFKNDSDRRHGQMVRLFLPRLQKVFANIPEYVVSLVGASYSEVQQAAVFKFRDSERAEPIFVQATPRYLQIGGMLDGKLVPDLLPDDDGQVISGWSSR